MAKKNIQKYSSKDTSINKGKLPRIYSILPKLGLCLDTMGSTIDYGCGKYFHSYNLPSNVRGYDPFNYPMEGNLCRRYKNAILSNVLNVVAEEEVRRDILETCKSLADTVYITIYEGDGSGIGKVTKKDCYQCNKKVKDYWEELTMVFDSVHFRKGVYICR